MRNGEGARFTSKTPQAKGSAAIYPETESVSLIYRRGTTDFPLTFPWKALAAGRAPLPAVGFFVLITTKSADFTPAAIRGRF